MAVALQSSITTGGNDSEVSPVIGTFPSFSAGDHLVIALALTANSTSPAPGLTQSAGQLTDTASSDAWEVHCHESVGGTSSVRLVVLTRIADGGEGSGFSFAVEGDTTGYQYVCAAYEPSVIGQTAGPDTGSSTTGDAPDIDPDDADPRIVMFWAADDDDPTAANIDNDFTGTATVVGYAEDSAPGNGCNVCMAHDAPGSGAAYTGQTFDNQSTEDWATFTLELIAAAAGPAITSIDTDSDTVDTRQNVAVAGSSFGASQGSGKVEIGNSATYGSATLVELPVDSWSDTSIQVDLEEAGTGDPIGDTLTLGTLYLYVTDDADVVSAPLTFTLNPPGPTPLDAVNTPVTLEVDTTYLLRLRIENTGGAEDTAFSLYAQNTTQATGWFKVTTSSTHVKAVSAVAFDTGDDVPETITGSGAYISNNDAASETGSITLPAAFAAAGAINAVFAFQVAGADVADEDALQFRVEQSDGTDLDTYTNTAVATVSEGGGAPTGSVAASAAAGVEFAAIAGAVSDFSAASQAGATLSALAGTVADISATAVADGALIGEAAGHASIAAAGATADAATDGQAAAVADLDAAAAAGDAVAEEASALASWAATMGAGTTLTGQQATTASLAAEAEASAAASEHVTKSAAVSAGAGAGAQYGAQAVSLAAWLAAAEAGVAVTAASSGSETASFSAGAAAGDAFAAQAVTAAAILVSASAGDQQASLAGALAQIAAAAEAGELWAAQATAVADFLAAAGADGTVAGLTSALATFSADAEAQAAFVAATAGAQVAAFSAGSEAAAQFLTVADAIADFSAGVEVDVAIGTAGAQAADLSSGATAGAQVSGAQHLDVLMVSAAQATEIISAVAAGGAAFVGGALAGATFSARAAASADFVAEVMAEVLIELPPEVRRVVGTFAVLTVMAASLSVGKSITTTAISTMPIAASVVTAGKISETGITATAIPKATITVH